MAKRLYLDRRHLLTAVMPFDSVEFVEGAVPFNGYLHRTTGEILFVLVDDADFGAHFALLVEDGYHWRDQDEVWQDHQGRRARLKADPDAWLAIPRYPGGGGGELNFALDFLAKNGIAAELVEGLLF